MIFIRTFNSRWERAPFYRSINTNISSYLFSNYFGRKQSPVPHFNSCYPAHTKPNMSFDMASRICTLVSVEELWIKKLEELKTFLVDKDTRQSCGWSHKECNKIQISEVRKVNREKTPKDSSTKIPFVVTNNPRNPNIFNAARHCLPVQHHSKTFKNIIKKTYLIYRRQPPNLKKFSQEPSLIQRKKYFGWKCEDFRCGTYAYIQTGQAILL